MAQVVAFQAALTRLGFGQAAIAALDANGLTGVRDLINLNEKDVEQLLNIIRTGPPAVVVPFLAQKRLNIFCYWATKRNRLNEPMAPGLFDQVAIDTYGAMMALDDKEDEVIVKAPGEDRHGRARRCLRLCACRHTEDRCPGCAGPCDF